jgi:hypothetical protein
METMERLLDVEVTASGTILEQLEIVYPMSGFRLRQLVEHLADGSYRILKLTPI